MGLGHVCVFWLVGWGGGSASGHGFVSGWLGKERGGGRVMVVYGGGGFGGGRSFLFLCFLCMEYRRDFLRFTAVAVAGIVRCCVRLLYWRLGHFFASAAQHPFLRFLSLRFSSYFFLSSNLSVAHLRSQ